MKRKQISVRLDEETLKKFKIACVDQGDKMQDVLERSVKDYVTAYEKKDKLLIVE